VRAFACVCVRAHVIMYVRMYYVCMYVCMYYVCMYVCIMYVCMYYVCMYVSCMNMPICVYTCVHTYVEVSVYM
jgi:hypothetical protein